MTEFVHLHTHTEYSLLDGASRIEDILEYAKSAGQTALAITDHGVMYGVITFYKAAKKMGIKPIIGCEVYITTGDMHEKGGTSRGYAHLILLAKNNIGYKNLMKLVSFGFTEGYYYKPRIDYDLLEQYCEGIICLSACIAGDIPSMLLEGDEAGAKKLALRLKNMFGEDFYIELQDHGLVEQKRLNPMLISLAKELDIPLVATNDIHYVRKEDAQAQDILMCIQTASYVGENKLSFGTQEFYLKDGDEMAALFKNVPEAIENTVKIAEKCNVEIEFGKLHLPEFDVPEGYTHEEYLDYLAIEGAKERYGDIEEVLPRLKYELSTIHSMGFTDYFLIVWDFVNFAKTHGIAVGPGRGSAAGSIAAYALKITDIDPIKYTLIFERFLNPERVTMPDIDIDFCYERRGEVIEYVNRKYGRDRVAQIITFGTLGAKQVVRDVARVMKISVQEADRIAKMIPFELKMTIQKAMERNPKLANEYTQKPEVKGWLDMAMKLEGMPRQASTHAAGVVISKEAVTEYVPLTINKKDDSMTTQYDKDYLEELGLLKMDFLGLKTLTAISHAVENIKETHGIDIDISHIDFEDKAVYEHISSGNTDGIFQLESAGMRDLMTKLRPENLGDIMVGISLFRPGPMAKIPDYIEGKNHPEKVTFDDPTLERVLSDTYGCMVYQEQVMEIVRGMAGYSMGRSDLVRRAMSKKKADVMQRERDVFIYGDGETVEGALKRGVSEKAANRVFDEMMDFAEYAFNKSHACAYAVVAYQTAYLMHYYEPEMMTALLNTYVNEGHKFLSYINYMMRSGTKLLPPDINKSESAFSVENGAVRFGLYALKNVGEPIEEIIKERKANGEFKDFYDFAARCAGKTNKQQMESLILSGAFDNIHKNRAQLMASFEDILKSELDEYKRKESGQLSIFDMMDEPVEKMPMKNIKEFESRIKLAYEKEKTSVYISGHPLFEYADTINKQKYTVESIMEGAQSVSAEEYDGLEVSLLGIITNVKVRSTKNKQLMANMTFEDLSGSINVIVFPRVFAAFEELLSADNIVKISGKIVLNEDAPPELNLIAIHPAGEKRKKLFLQIESESSAISKKISEILKRYVGGDEMVIYSKNSKKRYKKSGVMINIELESELKAYFGEKNVVIK